MEGNGIGERDRARGVGSGGSMQFSTQMCESSKHCLHFLLLSFFRFHNVGLNIDALKSLQRAERAGNSYFGAALGQ